MAFHVACPITCRRVCDCELGFPRGLRDGAGREGFLAEVAALEEFLRDPWTVRPFLEEEDEGAEEQREDEETVQVLVPRVAPPPLQPTAAAPSEDTAGGVGDELKRAAMQRKALAASVAAEDYVRRLESGGGADALGEAIDNNARDDQGSTVKIICRICFSGENEGSKKAIKMLSCKTCSKKYHISCLKTWAENRDLFHWNSWSCPSCRICEVCRRAGDPNKFMFCKRCDGAYHCYCQHPPHKNVGHGPYLCPKHTRCHSCGSTVPGSGLSTRWFLGYTCCDACGRLFVKGNYCPVCLKVYRDSEITPMVCCDVCERWVHCMCDGISDEKYQQFQVDSNLQYKCAACRGDCYQVKDIDDAVRELWKRRNIADRELMSSLRAAAGLPPQEHISSITPCSDDEQNGPVVLRNENNKALKFSVKGIGEKALKNSKDYGKNASNKKKKGYQIKIVGRTGETYQDYEKEHETRSLESIFRDQKIEEINSSRTDGPEVFSSPISQNLNDNGVKSCINEVTANDQSTVREAAGNSIDMATKVRIKGGKSQVLQSKESRGKNDTLKGTKLVIHLGSKSRNVSGSPHSETSSCHKDQDLAASFGSEDTIQQKIKDCKNNPPDNGRFIKPDDEKGVSTNNIKIPKRGVRNIVNIGKVSEGLKKVNGSIADECELNATSSSSPLTSKNDTSIATADAVDHRSEKVTLKHSVDTSVKLSRDNYDTATPKLSSASSNDHKPLLKLKFKNPYFEQRSSWAPQGEDENSVKGQRSKRKRPSTEKIAGREDAMSSQLYQENLMDAAIDASWILKKLGKDAVGKRVEVQSSDSSWKRGVISDVNQSSSTLSVNLDDGRFQALELGKQAIRFIPQKQKRSRT